MPLANSYSMGPLSSRRRAMELSGLILAVVAKDEREEEKDAAK